MEAPSAEQPRPNKKKRRSYEHGNYYGYYSQRRALGPWDPRLEFMDASWFAGKDCLDVGCNEVRSRVLAAIRLTVRRASLA